MSFPERSEAERLLADVKHRYGSYPQEKWDTNLWLILFFIKTATF